ncbi:histidinol-phosphate aminotransferase [Vibrio sp. JCM 19236]|nr:histidinol-phosphate aminotransferase [Vibrio sp. JCM 19236]
MDEGIILRNSPIADCVRISIGDNQECQRTIEFITQQFAV